MSLDSKKTIADILLAYFTMVGLIAAGSFALWEYYDHKDNLRLERTFKYTARLNSDPLHVIRYTLDTKWNRHNSEMREFLTDQNATHGEVARRYYDFVVAHIHKYDLSDEFLSIMEFFDELAVCIDGGLCDRDSGLRFFSRYARAFLNRYYPYLCELRSNWQDPSIGTKVEKLFFPDRTADVCAQFGSKE